MNTSATREQSRSAADVLCGLRASLPHATDWPRPPLSRASEEPQQPTAVQTPMTHASTATQSLASAPRNAEMLAAAAGFRLARMMADDAVPNQPELVATVGRMIGMLVRDGGPLPQLSAAGDGGVEVQWLVNGDLVAVIVDPDGDWILWAEDPGGVEQFEYEGSAGSDPPVSILRAAQAKLARMGRTVTFWPVSYS